MVATLRHNQPGFGRSRNVEQRGASRLVAEEPLSTRLPRPSLGLLKRILWPFLLLGLGFGTYEGAQRLLPYADRPIAKVSVKGDLSYISQGAVQQRIAPFVGTTFFQVDLADMRHELETMPWIAHAEVRRVWPDEISIRLEEQMPIARWGDEALLNNQGEAFAPQDLANYDNLPRLYGPKRAQQQVMQQYQMFSQMLRPLGYTVARLEMHERGSWYLTTGQGLELVFGRDQLVEKMRRFMRLYDQVLKAQMDNIARIDLRYPNGLAVAWRDPAVAATPVTEPAKH